MRTLLNAATLGALAVLGACASERGPPARDPHKDSTLFLSPAGKLIRQYDGGNTTTSNVAFGGPNHDQLFITGGIGIEAGEGALFRIDLGAKGLVILPAAKK